MSEIKQIKPLLLCDYQEDGRVSMERYASRILSGLVDRSGFQSASAFLPVFPVWLQYLPISQIMKLRMARFIIYPYQVRKLQADIFHIVDHGYTHLLPSLEPEKTVVTVHDLIPLLAHKKLIKGLDFFWPPFLVRFSLSFLRRVARIIAVSENTRNDLVRYLGCDPAKIQVDYNGLDKQLCSYSLLQREECRRSFNFPGGKNHYVLVSGVQAYKNHETSLKVISRLRELCKKPVFVVRFGASSSKWNSLIREHGLEDCQITIGPLAQKRVVDMYNSVDCLLFPSWYEGFGWPPLEAMACGIPVVTSNVASLPEVVGSAGIMNSPDDVEGLAQSVYKVLTNTDLRDTLVEKGLNRAKSFTWEKTADKIAEIYQSINSSQSLRSGNCS
ncbi:MAG: glycosyltransferase family 1 protein [Candidatus Riflebacteria bacterium]|nr:glycosyltransferase family 1 protein [Candidatus Riflebacteria bacterium]